MAKKCRLIKRYPSLCNSILEGDIFTQRFNSNFYESSDKKHSITYYEIENGLKEYWEEVPEIEVKKRVIFTTEDGVDMYDNKDSEFIYWVLQIPGEYTMKTNEWSISNAAVHIKNIVPHGTVHLKIAGILRFSSKESAEKYLLLNKPVLSLNDVSMFYKGALNGKNNNSKGLMDLAKSKI